VAAVEEDAMVESVGSRLAGAWEEDRFFVCTAATTVGVATIGCTYVNKWRSQDVEWKDFVMAGWRRRNQV